MSKQLRISEFGACVRAGINDVCSCKVVLAIKFT